MVQARSSRLRHVGVLIKPGFNTLTTGTLWVQNKSRILCNPTCVDRRTGGSLGYEKQENMPLYEQGKLVLEKQSAVIYP